MTHPRIMRKCLDKPRLDPGEGWKENDELLSPGHGCRGVKEDKACCS